MKAFILFCLTPYASSLSYDHHRILSTGDAQGPLFAPDSNSIAKTKFSINPVSSLFDFILLGNETNQSDAKIQK